MAWLPNNEFITEQKQAYIKPALLYNKQHYACSENTILVYNIL